MLAAFRILSGLFLFWYLILPSQNYALLLQWGGLALGIWCLFAVYFRSREFFPSSIFFFFSLLLSFHCRAAVSAGWIIPWYLMFFLTQWAIVLWLVSRNEILEASLFMTVILISPFYWPVLNVRNPTFVGFSFWVLALLHTIWLLWKTGQIPIPRTLEVLLIAAFLPIPFALYSWRALQFFLIHVACVLLYSAIAFSKGRRIKPLLAGYLYLVFSIALYVVLNDLITIQQIGAQTLAIRHHVLEHANTLAPLYIIFSSVLLFFLSETKSGSTRILLIAAIVLVTLLEFLTYSRNGWLAYFLFLAAYAVLLSLKKQQKISRALKSVAFVLVAVLIVLTLLTPVRSMIRQRFSDHVSTSARVFSWKLGWETFKENPFVGIGWFNYYAHAAVKTEKPLSNLELSSTMLDVHNHNVFLDLAEAGGLPLVVTFAVVLFVHFALPLSQKSALIAGLIGLTLNNVLDTASLWLTVYPHFWILLGLLRMNQINKAKESAALKKKWIFLGFLLLMGAGISWLVEDHFLQKAEFLHVNQRDREAIDALKIAGWAAPLDVIPRERLLNIHLSREDSSKSSALLQRLMKLKEDYAPYYSQLARVLLAANHVSAASANLVKAEQLDPYLSLQGNTYAVLSELQKRQGSDEYKPSIYRYLTSRVHLPESVVRELIDTIPEEMFLQESFSYINRSTDTNGDREFAIWHLHDNLRNLNKPEFAAKMFRAALQLRNDLSPVAIDDICVALAQYYSTRGLDSEIKLLIPYVSPSANSIIAFYQELARSDFQKAKTYLEQASRLNFFVNIPEEWESYFRHARKEEDLRSHYKTLQRIPRQDFPARFQEEIAKSFVREKKYDQAADAFHNLSLYDYSNPAPHWWEARMLWISGNSEAAAKENERLFRLISASVITQNLYRSRMEASHLSEVTIMRVALPNKSGGLNWRTAIYAHPNFRLNLPDGILLKRIAGEASIISNAWSASQDGFIFSIQNAAGEQLFSLTIDPRSVRKDRRWVPFEWQGQPQELMLVTDPVGDPNYDWAFISITAAD